MRHLDLLLYGSVTLSVVCRELGREYGFATVGGFPGGVDPIWLDHVRCTGNERSLVDCTHNGWGVYACSSHRGDSGVHCFDNCE